MQIHPSLQKLLTRLADKRYATVDARDLRLSWVLAGCPIAEEDFYTIDMSGWATFSRIER